LVRKLAVRKILRATSTLRFVNIVVVVAFLLALLGLVLYVVYTPTSLVLMESFLWLIEGTTFLGLLLAFKLAASRTVHYGARFEILRIEALAVVLVAILATIVTTSLIYRATIDLIENRGEIAPIEVSTYLIGSAFVSYAMSRATRRVMERRRIRIVTAHTIERKLSLDVVFEAGGGGAIVASNIFRTPLPENIGSIVMGIYVCIGLVLIAKEAIAYLIGVGPKEVVMSTRRDVLRVIKGLGPRYRLRKLRIETLGSFSEVELWIEAPPTMSLDAAYKVSVSLAREIVKNVPEVVRALVIMVPRSHGKAKLYRRSARRRFVRKSSTIGKAEARQVVAQSTSVDTAVQQQSASQSYQNTSSGSREST